MSILDSISSWFGGDPSTVDGPPSVDTTGGDTSSLPSELGGTSGDWLSAEGGVAADPGSALGADWLGGSLTNLLGGDAGTGPDLLQLLTGSSSAAPSSPAAPASSAFIGPLPYLDTSTPLTLGGSMNGLTFGGSTFGALAGPRRPSIPWARISRGVRQAVRLFGPQVALAIVAQIQQLLQARFAAAGIDASSLDSTTILMRVAGGGRRRGARGVTGRQITNARRTIRKLESFHHLLMRGRSYGYARRSSSCPPRRRARRR